MLGLRIRFFLHHCFCLRVTKFDKIMYVCDNYAFVIVFLIRSILCIPCSREVLKSRVEITLAYATCMQILFPGARFYWFEISQDNDSLIYRTFDGEYVNPNDREWHSWCFYWDKSGATKIYKDSDEVGDKKGAYCIIVRYFDDLS